MSELNTMNLTELKEQADVLEIKYASNIGEAALRAKIADVLGESSVEDDEYEIVGPENSKTIVIAIDGKDKQPVFVGVNGRVFRMKRGVEVTVPQTVIEALTNAVQVLRDPETGEDQRVMSYPFSIVK